VKSKEDVGLGSIRSFQRREAFKSKQDGIEHDPGVKEKITNMYDKHAKQKNVILQQEVLKSIKSA
jgi:hypothetical protein